MNTQTTNQQSASTNAINVETHQKANVRRISKPEWLKLHSDFKSEINGQKYILSDEGGRGTCLVPVELMATKSDATVAIKTLRRFVSPAQLRTLADGCRSEEMQFFFDKIVEMTGIINGMPQTYQTDGQGEDAIAHLHYFIGDSDFYITEKDMYEEQHQAFGLVKMWERELGYISIDEITHAGAELDLHWTPKPIKDC